MIGSFVESTENMFEILLFITAIFMLRFLVLSYQAQREDIEEEEEYDIDRLRATEIELEDINGIWYAWVHDPEDGYQYVGQSTDRKQLVECVEDMLRKRYTIPLTN
jgi:hypothetical protein